MTTDQESAATPGLHPDLVRIRQAIEGHDALARGGVSIEALHEGLADYDSLFVASQDRAGTVMREMHPLAFMANPAKGLSATWADGFLVGVRFARHSAEGGS